jgi:tRNA wybutosine-synthesizing protein 3
MKIRTPQSIIAMASTLPQSFVSKKTRILSQLSIPSSEYNDLSPKGSIDIGIRDLIDEINELEGCVTTSSCAGRVSVFLEGKKSPDSTLEEGNVDKGERFEVAVKGAGVGGKGGGGRWLFVSHDPVQIEGHSRSWTETLGMQQEESNKVECLMKGDVQGLRFIHFKFEPMVSL